MVKITPIDISQAYTYGVSDEAAQELVEWRLMKKDPLTQRAFDRAMKVCLRCNLELGIPSDEAISLTIDSGWKGVVFEYIKASLGRRKEAAGKELVIAGPDNFIERATNRDWAH